MNKETIEVICILCPVGCRITAEMREGEILSLRDAGCRRGIDYAKQEIKSPVRDFFTTVRVKNGRSPVVSVRSTGPVPKSMLMRCVSELAKMVIPAPVKIGDVIVKNLLNLGVDVIATRDVEEA